MNLICIESRIHPIGRSIDCRDTVKGGFYEQAVLIDRMFQENKQRATNEMMMIEDIDQLLLIDGLCGLEIPEQVSMFKKSWGSELVFLTAILIGFTIHANEFPLSLNS